MTKDTPPAKRPSAAFYSALGHTIKVARTDLGIERAELAERAGISYSYLAAIENGQKQPSSKVLLVIADALGLRSHQLLESAEDRHDRRMGGSDEYPGWLTGEDRALAFAGKPELHTLSARDAEAPSASWFVDEIQRLAPELSTADRDLLLAMARRMAGR